MRDAETGAGGASPVACSSSPARGTRRILEADSFARGEATTLDAVTRPPTGVLLLYYRGADPAVCASGSSRESVHSGR